jgi:hypothetical protein
MASTQALLEDPLHEKETFVGDIAGIVMTQGNVAITLANRRVDEPCGGNGPRTRRVVVGRLVLSLDAASTLLKHLQFISENAHTFNAQTVAGKSAQRPN